MYKKKICFFILCIFLLPIFSQHDTTLRSEFRIEIEPIDPLIPILPDKEEIARRILEIGRRIFSGFVFGYRFTYTPLDKTREVSEFFSLTPISEIKWGDKALTISTTRIEDAWVYAYLEYIPNTADLRRMNSWDSILYIRSQGIGSAAISGGWEYRFKAIDEAIKNAIREYARSLVLNKPKEIKGELIFDKTPYIVIINGEYTAQVKIRLLIKEIISYKIY